MPSNQSHQEELSPSGEQPGQSIHWNRKDPATEEEMETFWTKLRHFYRTSEKPDDPEEPMSSALLSLLENNASPYPYTIGTDREKTTIEFEERAPLYLLEALIQEHQQENSTTFKAKLTALIAGLNKLLDINDEPAEVETFKGVYDFAHELIAFDKMVDMIPRHAVEILTDKRLKRLTAVMSILKKGLNHFSQQEGILVVGKELKAYVEKESLFESVTVVEARSDAFAHCQELFANEVQSFTALIKAYRIAKMEVEGTYKEDIHDEYFEHFTWYRLLPDELNLFQPIVLVVPKYEVFDHLTSLSRLFASNQPINVVVLNQELISVPDHRIKWEDAAHHFRQEIAALAIAHRNVYTFQSGMDDPLEVYDGLSNCLKSTCPSICHLSIPKDTIEDTVDRLLIAKAENASRYFPRIIYDPGKDSPWGGKFDLTKNIQPKEKWPIFALSAHTGDEKVRIEVAYTYADYKAIYPEKSRELMWIPSNYYTEHLIPLNEYLNMDQASLYGKIPYIWLIDKDCGLHRAAVPNVWVVSCQERLDFWSFLQELGGLNCYHANIAIEKKELEMAEIIKEAKIQMEMEHKQLVAAAQEEAIAKASERLIAVLLDDEALALSDVDSNASIDTQQREEDVVDQQEFITEDTPTAQVTSDKPWVESENCTTCNECTDKYPNLFKYNEEKQAYIDDPTKGTYEELVKAAENCPAACIHPGMPLNTTEPNIDKLIKRATKFN